MNITVKITKVYGKEAIYPECANGMLFAHLTGTKTLSRDNIKTLQQLGYTINVAHSNPFAVTEGAAL